jgi:hypothetical protein
VPVVGPTDGLTLADGDGGGVVDGSAAVLAGELVCLVGDEWPAAGELLALRDGGPVVAPTTIVGVDADDREAADADWAAACCLSP